MILIKIVIRNTTTTSTRTRVLYLSESRSNLISVYSSTSAMDNLKCFIVFVCIHQVLAEQCGFLINEINLETPDISNKNFIELKLKVIISLSIQNI